MSKHVHWRWVGLFAFGAALVWAGYTDHVWEDYFITYRSSKNLAEGQGLVFQPGERLHTFTSPLGVLLPALACGLAGDAGDRAALWIFRLMGAAAFAGAVALVAVMTRREFGVGGRKWAPWFMAGLVLVDPKSIDFATNGMETPFLLLGFAWCLWIAVTQPSREWLHWGGAWALLMWGRPDSFVYIAGLGLGTLLFRTPRAGNTRAGTFVQFLRAGLLTTFLYGPWLMWSKWYYGTPVPHTVKAKGLFGHEESFLARVVDFPERLFGNTQLIAATFLPPYAPYVDWPAWAVWLALPFAYVGLFLWVWPRFGLLTRLASFVAFGGQFYLCSFVNWGVPWYLPSVAFFSLVALGAAAVRLLDLPGSGRGRNLVRRGTAGLALLGTAALTVNMVMAAYQLHWQQKLVEWGNRQRIGEWLREQASTKHDTVLLEPLGYIGFFSQLKMIDYPGLSSPEMVAARQIVDDHVYPDCWSKLIPMLQPDWVVIRSYELAKLERIAPFLFADNYELAKEFDVRESVNAVAWLPGRNYLLNDAHFLVYRRVAPKLEGLPVPGHQAALIAASATEKHAFGEVPYDSEGRIIAGAPSVVRFDFERPQAFYVRGGFGIFDGAYLDHDPGTDGAGFTVTVELENGSEQTLFHRALNPRQRMEDRGRQLFEVLCSQPVRAVVFRTDPGADGSNAFDWTYWENLRMMQPLFPDGYPGTWRPAY